MVWYDGVTCMPRSSSARRLVSSIRLLFFTQLHINSGSPPAPSFNGKQRSHNQGYVAYRPWPSRTFNKTDIVRSTSHKGRLPQYAIAFFGGVSRVSTSGNGKRDTAFEIDAPINMSIVASGWLLHLMGAHNGGRQNFDIYIHCWAVNEEPQLRLLYSPTMAIFETNKRWTAAIEAKINAKQNLCSNIQYFCPFGAISSALSQRQVLRLVAKGEVFRGQKYELIILARPDVLVFRDMVLSSYEPSVVGLGGDAISTKMDYYYVFGSALAQRFGGGFDRIRSTDYLASGWRIDDVNNFVTPGRKIVEHASHFECFGVQVFRKLCMCFRLGEKFKRMAKNIGGPLAGLEPLSCPASLRYLGLSTEELAKVPFEWHGTSGNGEGSCRALAHQMCSKGR